MKNIFNMVAHKKRRNSYVETFVGLYKNFEGLF